MASESGIKYFSLFKYIPFFCSLVILFLVLHTTINIEKIYDKNYMFIYYKYHYYTIYDIIIDTTFGKIYLKPFTPIQKVYSEAFEFSNPPYHSEYVGIKIGYDKYADKPIYLEHDLIILDNKIENMYSITFYLSGGFKIEIGKQELILMDNKYEIYKTGEVYFDLDENVFTFSFWMYDYLIIVENK